MPFEKEADFENALIDLLTSSYGWEKDVLCYKTEADLLRNWADILFENNRHIDRLNDAPLTDGEMQQLIEQLHGLRSPVAINRFINGYTVAITRDNPDDRAHCGKEVSLDIFDRKSIFNSTRYQIARQPKFAARNSILPDRRGDFMLLINGMPVIHVELKKSGVPVSQAITQIEKYSKEGLFSGLFSLVQIFVAMTPEETRYFANPGPDGTFNPDYYFHWADFNNDPMHDWREIASNLLSIPMAHQLIGYYTVADDSVGVLKVMRSYQFYAAREIFVIASRHNWETGGQRGGHIWHTTGSGKTLTSFKSAQLIAHDRKADKVVFLIDRIELGTQSAGEYRSFAAETDAIQETEDTARLVAKLKSTNPADTLIVTSIQKLSNLGEDTDYKLKQADLDAIMAKRIVFIVDECHRSVFGDMMHKIKMTFVRGLFFGFTGTPIQIENAKKGCNTADVFGDELHRYSIADGIRDRNVLGFDPDKVLTFREIDQRRVVALDKANAASEEEALADPKKKKIYLKYMHDVPMAGYRDAKGKYVAGIEDSLRSIGQYRTAQHQNAVVSDICDNWLTISCGYQFHALFATSSIEEACEYYRLFKTAKPELKVTALFDPNISENEATTLGKEEALAGIIADYNGRYGQTYTVATWARMKKDIQARLAHKKPYQFIERDRDAQIDLLIVVDQMLTGYDSKWINTLYLDKVLNYESVIQAFSRTNRLFGLDKRFGIIKYYRAPYTMERNINDAVKLYSGDKPFSLFALKLDRNLENMNAGFTQIRNLFEAAGIANFERLPEDPRAKGQFAKLFKALNYDLAGAKVQGFSWQQRDYTFARPDEPERTVSLLFDENTYLVLLRRYQELGGGHGGGGGDESPYDLDSYITTIDTGKIDAEYMNYNFEKFRNSFTLSDNVAQYNAKTELHKSFASLSQEEQKFANIILRDLETGTLVAEEGKTIHDYINVYMNREKEGQIEAFVAAFGLDAGKLRDMLALHLTENNLDEFSRFTELKATVDRQKAKAYFEHAEGVALPTLKVVARVSDVLKKFIVDGIFTLQGVGKG